VLGEDADSVTTAAYDDATDDHDETVEKIGDLAASAGIRRVHVLAWRDLDDVEAGGSEVHIDEIARCWAAAGIDLTMRTSWAQGQPGEASRNGYRVIRRAGRQTVFPRAAAAEALGRTGPRDLLIEIWNGMPFLSPLWCRGPRIVFLHHVHAEMWQMTLPPALAKFGEVLERRIAPPFYRRTRIVTLSESSKSELVDDLGFSADQVTVVHPGIDPRFSPGGERHPQPLMVACGRIVPVKRYDQLLRVAHRARRHVPNLQLHIVGEGYERPKVEALIDELDAASWVTLRGHVTDGELVDLYRKAWIVASASAREGWGMTLTEAAACGTPAVATRIAGHEDAIVDGVSGVLADDDDELADAMVDVLTDRRRLDQLSQGAIARAGSLTWGHTATQVMRIAAEEVSKRRSAP
jgi:glycosyltransferase involved in cell wall biosynthesis